MTGSSTFLIFGPLLNLSALLLISTYIDNIDVYIWYMEYRFLGPRNSVDGVEGERISMDNRIRFELKNQSE